MRIPTGTAFTRVATIVLSFASLLITGATAQAEKFKVIYSFTDAGNPIAGLVLDAAGNLYGTATGLGRSPGSVFELSRESGKYRAGCFSPA